MTLKVEDTTPKKTVLLEGVLRKVQSSYKAGKDGVRVVTTVAIECEGLVSEDVARLYHMQRADIVAEVGKTQGELEFHTT